MLLVVDANVVFSALVNKGNSFKVFECNKKLRRFEFIAPELLFSEMQNRTGKLLSVTKLTEEELFDVFLFIKKQIKLISFSNFSDRLPEAIELNLKDSPYLALALKFNCPIFSGDKGLKKQDAVKVFSPRELLDILGIE